MLIVTLVVIGLSLAVAAHALRLPQAASEKRRSELISSINDRQRTIDQDSRTINSTQAKINELQAKALSRQHDTSLADRLKALELTTGTAAAQGPGLVLTLNDAAGAGTDAQGNPGPTRPIPDVSPPPICRSSSMGSGRPAPKRSRSTASG
ncbi:hypothetical protein [Flexivirga alba]|uniref:DUF2746 domain-containing protein n=1 Tax=Flexivirga alba TaxID=702742 RepID=A0ABW2AJE8_9MICO